VTAPGIQKTINRVAIKASPPPKKKGADGPSPFQPPIPCHRMPAIKEDGKAKSPMTAFYVP